MDRTSLSLLLRHPSILIQYITLEKEAARRSAREIASEEQIRNLRKKYHKELTLTMPNWFRSGEWNRFFEEEDEMLVPYFITRIYRPKVAIETGVNHGQSTFLILLAMNENHEGKLFSIDQPQHQYWRDDGTRHSESVPGKNSGWLARDSKNLGDRWQYIIGLSNEKLPSLLREIGTELVDLFYHDSEHTRENVLSELEQVWPYLSKNGIIIIDDYKWNTASTEFTNSHSTDTLWAGKNKIIMRKRSD